MTKKHFNAAVKIVQAIDGPDVGYYDRNLVAQSFIKLFEQYNDKFDKFKFIEACGLVRN